MTPVNVFAKIPKERLSISVPALIDVLLIALIFMLTSSKFVLAPGLSVSLSSDEALPEMSSPDFAITDSDLSVLTANGNSMLIFDGSIYDRKSLAKKMKTLKSKNDVLLIKADKSLTVQSLMEIAEIAKLGGFKQVHIAAKPQK